MSCLGKIFLVAWILVALCMPVVSADNKEAAVIPVLHDVRIHIGKGGVGWIKVSHIVSQPLPCSSAEEDAIGIACDILSCYGLQNKVVEFESIDSRTTRVVSRAKLNNVFQLVEVLDSGYPFLLYKKQAFDVRWNGSVFRLHLKYNYSNTSKHDTAKSTSLLIHISTDGRFTDNSTGQLNASRSSLTCDTQNEEFILEIEGLSIEDENGGIRGTGDWGKGELGGMNEKCDSHQIQGK